VLACIRKNEARLSDRCRAKATAIERIAHRELAHNAEVGAACAIELQSHCAATLHREASEASQKPTTRLARASARAPAQAEETSAACLDRHSRTQGARKFGDTCSNVLLEYQLRATESLDLLDEVRKPCAVDYANLCAAASAQSHPGAAMQCLKDNRDLLHEDKCHEAVLGAMARAAADARLDPLLAQKCAAEMRACAAEGIVSGEGRVHACLRRKAREQGLSAACTQQVFKAQQAELEDVRLNYPVQSACKVELVRFCAQVPPGQARRLACLEAHAAEKDFGKSCTVVLRRSLRDSVHDYRLLPRLAKACAEPIRTQCTNIAPGDSAVISCLLESEQAGRLKKACGFEVRGAARTAFLSFEWNQGVTQVCDADIWSQCAGEGGARTLPLQPRPGAGGGPGGGPGGGAGLPPPRVSADTNNDGTLSGYEV